MSDTPASPAEHRVQPGRKPAVNRKLLVIFGAVALAVVAIDQATKAIALHTLTVGEPVDVIGQVLRLSLTFNPGAAFSIGSSATWLLFIVACAVVVVVVVQSRRLGSLAWALTLGLLLGGALGNLADRIFRAPGFGRGYVVDFIDYGGLFIGNVADIAIVIAAVLIALLSLRAVPFGGVGSADAAGGADGACANSGGAHGTGGSGGSGGS